MREALRKGWGIAELTADGGQLVRVKVPQGWARRRVGKCGSRDWPGAWTRPVHKHWPQTRQHTLLAQRPHSQWERHHRRRCASTTASTSTRRCTRAAASPAASSGSSALTSSTTCQAAVRHRHRPRTSRGWRAARTSATRTTCAMSTAGECTAPRQRPRRSDEPLANRVRVRVRGCGRGAAVAPLVTQVVRQPRSLSSILGRLRS